MSNFVITFFLSVGIGAWLYSKLARRSGGGNSRPAIIGAAVITVILFIIIYLTLGMILKK